MRTGISFLSYESVLSPYKDAKRMADVHQVSAEQINQRMMLPSPSAAPSSEASPL